MIKRSKEYDAFGPWIYIIDEEHTMPPIFVDFHLEKDNPLLMIKIPRQIERRNANPDMHLYDSVIGIFDTYMHVLTRKENSVTQSKVYFKDIQAIKKATCLLNGEIFFYLKDEIYKISYNTVSDDIMTKMISLIKQYLVYEQKNLGLPVIYYNLDNVEFLYVNLINSLRKEDKDMELVAYQPNIIVEKHLFSRIIKFLLNKLYYKSTAFITNNKELIIIEKGAQTRDIDAYYFSHLYLSYKLIKSVELIEHPNNEELKMLKIKTLTHDFDYTCNEENTGIDGLYSAVAKILS